MAVLSCHILRKVDAETWYVGDDTGDWTIPATSNDLNYTAWAEFRNIRYGDTLCFNYDNQTHSLVQVNASSFHVCLLLDPIQVYSCGRDTIQLMTPGVRDYYFVCAEPSMCTLGQKLHITLVGDVPAAEPKKPSVVQPSSASATSSRLQHSAPLLPPTFLLICLTGLLSSRW
ncbi:hypothetical protein R1sor_012075 [Riccia sorocarpa]|uniref:Phytocyanin domain-containing protein n=1 Tax=Riccia sorocarpa TaxID=122646 RepID=A0ABD3I8W0_9MARC